MEGHGAPAHVLFGLDPMWVSACLLVVTYAVIITERINRSIIALLGAGLMVDTWVRRAVTQRRASRELAEDPGTPDRAGEVGSDLDEPLVP